MTLAFFLAYLLNIAFSEPFDCSPFDSYNPFENQGGSEKNPWADKFGNVWSNDPDAKSKPSESIDPSKFQSSPLPLKELWETTKNPYAKKKPEGFNFKLPDEFNKPTEQMGRFDMSPPKSFFDNPFAPSSQEKKTEQQDDCKPQKQEVVDPCSSSSLPPPPPPSSSHQPCPPDPCDQSSSSSYSPRNYHRRPYQNRNRFFEADC